MLQYFIECICDYRTTLELHSLCGETAEERLHVYHQLIRMLYVHQWRVWLTRWPIFITRLVSMWDWSIIMYKHWVADPVLWRWWRLLISFLSFVCSVTSSCVRVCIQKPLRVYCAAHCTGDVLYPAGTAHTLINESRFEWSAVCYVESSEWGSRPSHPVSRSVVTMVVWNAEDEAWV